MLSSFFHIRFERVDPARNMARFYRLAIELSLFGEIAVVSSWGRIGTVGRSQADYFASERDAICAFLALVRIRRQRGYRPRS